MLVSSPIHSPNLCPKPPGKEYTNVRVNILSRYTRFFQSLISHRSSEVSTVANLVGRNITSKTGQNLNGIQRETGLNPWVASPSTIKAFYHDNVTCAEADLWRIKLLDKYLQTRDHMEHNLEDTTELVKLINSLCST